MNILPKAFFTAEPGMIARFGGRKYRITHLVSIDSVFAVDLLTNESARLRIDSLLPNESDNDEPVSKSKDLAQFSDDEWAKAQMRFQAIKPLLENPFRSRADAEAIATQHGVHASTLYKWLKTYQDAGHVSALVSTKRGRRSGVKLLNDEQEKLVNTVIEDEYLTGQRNKPQHIVEEVERRARLAKIPAPHPNTIRNRIKALSIRDAMKSRGHKEIARNLYEPIRGAFPGADFPLSVVQIDHTPADIILVDEVHRKPIGRPWLTLAIDTWSRMVVGLYITFEKPSSTSVGMCVSHAICPKREYLARLGVAGDWPVWGVMDVIHVDNAKEFRGAVLERGCDEYSIDLQWRPPARPHYGGHIERLMGTMANQIRKWPGATFSNTAERKGYDSEAQAALTLSEFERLVVDFIVNVYQQRKHAELGMPPRRKWELGILGDTHTRGKGIPPVPADPVKLQLDFMPFFERSVQQYGIQIDLINYYDPVLNPYINSTDADDERKRQKYVIRRDPRDISKIYFWDVQSQAYVTIPYRNIGRPAMSAWELKELQRQLREEGAKSVDENTIFEALGRMRTLVESAVQKTKAARRQATRNPAVLQVADKPRVPVALPEQSPPAWIEEDPFAQPIVPFEDISVSR